MPCHTSKISNICEPHISRGNFFVLPVLLKVAKLYKNNKDDNNKKVHRLKFLGSHLCIFKVGDLPHHIILNNDIILTSSEVRGQIYIVCMCHMSKHTNIAWPLSTSKDLGDQNHIGYVTSWCNMSIHTKMASLAVVIKVWP